MTAETTQGGGQSAEVVALVEEKAEHLYVAFWSRQPGRKDAPQWLAQAEAIREMWRNIAKDAFSSTLLAALKAAHSHNTALSEAVGALEAIRHMSSPAKRIDEPRLRLDAVSDLVASTLSRLKSSTGGGE